MSHNVKWLSGILVVLAVAPAIALPGDFDNDCDLDLDDFLAFHDCRTEPFFDNDDPSSPECLAAFDFDRDFDVDLRDFVQLQRWFTDALPPQEHDLFTQPICDQIVQVGDAVEMTIVAEDPKFDVRLMVEPMPLPAGARFDTTTGKFRFVPSPEQVGSFELAFLAETPERTDEQVVNFTVEESIASGSNSIVGVVWGTDNQPIGGVTVIAGDIEVVTNVLGGFLLDGVDEETVNIVFDGSTVPPQDPEDPPPFPIIPEQIELVLGHPMYVGVRNVVHRPVFLPAIDWDSADPVDPKKDSMITSSDQVEVEMLVRAQSARNPDGTEFEGLMAISDVPPEQAPIALPEALSPAQLISIQPGGVRLTGEDGKGEGAPITFANRDEMPIGSEVDIWSIDPSSGTFQIVGVGQVVEDGEEGTKIVTVSGGIRTASWHAVLPPIPPSTDDTSRDGTGWSCPVGSQGNIRSGVLEVDHELVGHRTMDEGRGLRLVYRSDRVTPRPIIAAMPTVSRQAAVPTTISIDATVGGVRVEAPVYYDSLSSLEENRDETIRVAVQCDARRFGTGVYDTFVQLTSNYPRSSVSSFLVGQILVDNRTHTNLGAGWGIAGLQRVWSQPDGDVLITDGDGSLRHFARSPEIPITDGLSVWLSSDSVPGVGDGEPVTLWLDRSGRGNHFFAPTESARPTLVSGIVGGKPVVRFDGVDDGLRTPGQLISGNSFTLFTVMSVKPGSTWAWQIGEGTQILEAEMWTRSILATTSTMTLGRRLQELRIPHSRY
jgi:hypothetical protein